MINRNTSSNENEPFLLQPAGKDYLWGGRRLKDDFSKNIEMSPLAETWECSTHPDGPSMIASGIFSGESLSEILKRYPEFLGTHPMGNHPVEKYAAGMDPALQGELPILIKLIDAKQNLSVQVHPDDEYAGTHENGQLGKTEMWYVLDAAKNTKIIYGLCLDTEKDVLQKALVDGTIDKYMQKVPIKKDDVFYIEAGTIHAIGEGALIAEIQENSNLTYRLYDYDRVDQNGKKRTLHVEKALSAANLKSSEKPKQPVRVLRYRPGAAEELLCRCKYFEVHRMLVNTERKQTVRYRADTVSFRVLLCVCGCGTISWKNNLLNIYKGDCVFFPANSVEVHIHGQLQMLSIRG